METTLIAEWLNSVFRSYDYYMLNALHNFAETTNGTFTPLLRLISFLGENGIALLILGLIFLFFQNARKTGMNIILGIAIGFLITNVIVKNLVARQRPYIDETGIYYSWWLYIKGPVMSEFSFPSGHVTATMAAMTALFLNGDRRYSWTAFLFVVLMGISRNYLMVHFPSDILGGMISGGIGAVIGYYIIRYIYAKRSRCPE